MPIIKKPIIKKPIIKKPIIACVRSMRLRSR
jgi:hypothetical protein